MRTHWHALHVHGHYDRWMRRHGLVPFVPTEERILYVSKLHRKRRTLQPIFPGLAFVCLEPPVDWFRILQIPFVRRPFAPYGEPYQFTESDVNDLRRLAGLPVAMPYAKGDVVRFVSGPLKDTPFEVARVDFQRDDADLLANILGRITRISARASQLRKEAA
jgi:transcription antitermination factor NusG